MLDHPEFVAKFKSEAAPYILSRYSWDRVVDQMLEIYGGNVVEYEEILRRYEQKS